MSKSQDRELSQLGIGGGKWWKELGRGEEILKRLARGGGGILLIA